MMTSPPGISETEGKKEAADQTFLLDVKAPLKKFCAPLWKFCEAPVEGSTSSSPAIHSQRSETFPVISFDEERTTNQHPKSFNDFLERVWYHGLDIYNTGANLFLSNPVEAAAAVELSFRSPVEAAAAELFWRALVEGSTSSSSSSAIHLQRSETFPGRASPNALNGSASYNPSRLSEGSLTHDEERTTNQHPKSINDFLKCLGRHVLDFYRTGANLFFSANRETPNNGLPVSVPANAPVTFITFLGGVLDIPSTIRPVLIFLFGGLLKFLSGGDSPGAFEFKSGITTKASESILTLGEAIFAYESEIILVVLYLICYSLSWMLILPLHHGMVVVLGILLLCAPMLFLPNLVRKASSSGVRVALGSSFNMSLTGFTFTAAFGFFLIFGLVALLVLYFIWIFVRGRTPARGEDNEERRALWNVASLFGL